MRRKVLAGLVTTILALVMMASTAFAAPVAVYNNAQTADDAWGKNGPGDLGDMFIKLHEKEDFDIAEVGSIATVEVVIDTETHFKPQFIFNTEGGGWQQAAFEYVDPGHYVEVLDATGKFSPDFSYNEFVIQSGWKAEGAVQLTAIAFKDADGNVLYSLGDYEEGAEDEDVVEDVGEDEPLEDDVAEEPVTAVPKTGVASFALIYGLGALASGIAVLKKRNK